jgi:hypothetical protein
VHFALPKQRFVRTAIMGKSIVQQSALNQHVKNHVIKQDCVTKIRLTEECGMHYDKDDIELVIEKK